MAMGVESAPSENEYQKHFLGVKAAGAWGWRPHHLHVPNVMKISGPKPPGTLWGTPGLLRDSFIFFYRTCNFVHCYKVPLFLELKKETVLVLHLCKNSTSLCLQVSVPDGAAHPSQCAYAAGRWHRDRQDVLCAGHVDVSVVRTRLCLCIGHLQCADYSKSSTGMWMFTFQMDI